MDLTNFTYGNQPVRTIIIDGEPGFIANDLCAVLEIRNPRDTVAGLDDDEKGVATTDTLGGAQQMTYVTEAGMYSLVLRSRKPEAKAFKRWITHEVLPQIRKTGSYGQAAPTGPALLALAVLEANQMIEAKDQRIAVLEPKAASWDSIVSSAGSWSYNDAAKVICESGEIQIGEKRLVNRLVDWGYLYRDSKRRPHVYQRFLEKDLFTVKARTYTDHVTGETLESSAPQVRITGKGLGMIRKRLLSVVSEVAA